jgi:hypothetical protein
MKNLFYGVGIICVNTFSLYMCFQEAKKGNDALKKKEK